MPKRLQVWKESSKNFNVTDATVTMDGNNAVVNVNYLLPAGNLYIVNYTIYPSGAVNVAARFTSKDMDAAQTEVSESTRTATFTPGRDAARKEFPIACEYSEGATGRSLPLRPISSSHSALGY